MAARENDRMPPNILQLIEDGITFLHDFEEKQHSVTRRLNSLLAGEIALRAVLDMLKEEQEQRGRFGANAEAIRGELDRLKCEGARLIFDHTVSTVEQFLQESMKTSDREGASVSAGIALGYVDNALHQDKLLDEHRDRLATYREEIRRYLETL